MTTYIERQVIFRVSENQNGEGKIISRGDRSTRFDALDDLIEGELLKYVISAPTTDKDLLSGSTIAAARILYIETDVEIRVKLDDTADTGFLVTPVDSDNADTKRGTLYLEGNFTHVYVSVGGTTDANVIMGVVGA